MGKTSNIEQRWLESARALNKTIVLPEAGFSDRVTKAGIEAAEQKIAKIILLVSEDKELESYNIVESDYLKVINVKTHECREMLVSALYEKRKAKGLDMAGANKLIDNRH